MFRPTGADSAVDAALRDTVLPELCRVPGIRDAYAGRLGEDESDRVIATIWRGAALTAPEPRHELRLLHQAVPADAPAPDAVTVQVLPLDVAARFDRPEPAGILRIFRGTVRTGGLEAYIAEAQGGMLRDAADNEGLVAFYLGRAGQDDFVTVSAWTGWAAIERATGGNVREPFATRNSERLASFAIRHFEILPDLQRPVAEDEA
jgi:hypothetical protein